MKQVEELPLYGTTLLKTKDITNFIMVSELMSVLTDINKSATIWV